VTTVAVYGSINWDEICQLPRYPEAHEKLEAIAIQSALGGSAANTATWLAPLVERVELIGAVGDDAEGALCRDWLHAAGVGHACVDILEERRTSRACAWVVEADKRIVTFREPGIVREQAPPLARVAAATAQHLHLGSLVDGAALDCLRAARHAGATVSIELSGKPHDEVRPHADLVFLNTQELRTHFGIELAELDVGAVASVVPKRGATLVITNGPESVTCARAESIRHFPVTALDDVVDRTGGGDAFDAGFIAGWLARGHELRHAVATGLECARRALMQVGGARASA
jgi:ribokinase